MTEQTKHDAGSVAAQILLLARNTLSVRFRFLNRALSRLTPTQVDGGFFATDGRRLLYEPWTVLNLYRAEPSAVTRNYLHALLHCVFRHGFVGRGVDRPRWDAACDIAVERLIASYRDPSVAAGRERRQAGALSMLAERVKPLSAERIYHWLRKQDFTDGEIAELRADFVGDDHAPWYDERFSLRESGEEIELAELWEDVAKRMQTELTTLSQDGGDAMTQALKQINRAKRSYTDFLRRFGVYGEELRLSEEEYDNVYYTYGLSLYGNLPLIEPLETSWQSRIRDFVIAVDTSGSVRGDVVQSFIQHTHDILAQQNSFFSQMNLHILQCDDRVREDAKITSRDEFARYLSAMELKGFGETDFRPVFAHVDALVERGEFENLRGLLYFTDGRGTFPARKPSYETAFILHSGGCEDPPVPVWAMRMTMSEDSILDGEFSGY